MHPLRRQPWIAKTLQLQQMKLTRGCNLIYLTSSVNETGDATGEQNHALTDQDCLCYFSLELRSYPSALYLTLPSIKTNG